MHVIPFLHGVQCGLHAAYHTDLQGINFGQTSPQYPEPSEFSHGRFWPPALAGLEIKPGSSLLRFCRGCRISTELGNRMLFEPVAVWRVRSPLSTLSYCSKNNKCTAGVVSNTHSESSCITLPSAEQQKSQQDNLQGRSLQWLSVTLPVSVWWRPLLSGDILFANGEWGVALITRCQNINRAGLGYGST